MLRKELKRMNKYKIFVTNHKRHETGQGDFIAYSNKIYEGYSPKGVIEKEVLRFSELVNKARNEGRMFWVLQVNGSLDALHGPYKCEDYVVETEEVITVKEITKYGVVDA